MATFAGETRADGRVVVMRGRREGGGNVRGGRSI